MKKRLSYILIIVLIIILLLIALFFKLSYSTENKTDDEENIIDNEVVDLLSIDDEDENIIGYITIEKIELYNAPIAEGTDSDTISKYIGHFEGTSYLDGNVCLCSHNRGSKAAYFEQLKNVSEGDLITYTTKYETKIYEVQEIKEIEETDLSVLEQTEDNKITLITCIANQKNLRLCVIGVEVGE